MKQNFDNTCEYFNPLDASCLLGHTECSAKCLDFELFDEEYIDTTNDEYEYDEYDYFDDYLDDLNDGEIPDDDW